MRHDPGLAASPPVRYILEVEGSGYSSFHLSSARCVRYSPECVEKRNSAKFTVANDPSGASPSTRLQHGDTLLASIRSNLVPFVAPIYIKGLRLVTVQLPEKSSSIGPGINRTSPLRSSRKFALKI